MTNTAKEMEGLQVTTPSDQEIAMTRVFDAPRTMVFDAYTKPALVKRWLGVFAGWSMAVCEIDLKVGGKYRYVWRHASGAEMGMGGVYLDVAAPERLVTSEKFDETWYEGECIGTVTFVEKGGKTTMTMLLRYDSKVIRDAVLKSPMKEGISQGYDMLAELLAKS